MKRLKGKVAIITGGARGIGKATAAVFAREGAKIAIWDVNEETGNQTVKEFIEAGHEAKFYKVNTVSLEETLAAAKAVNDDFGRIHILINNAGITRDATVLKMEETEWQQVIDVNLTGVYHCTKAVSPFMVEHHYGRIISASSVVGLYGNFGQTNYVATKAGVIGMTKVWSKELGRKGITVNAVAPGFITTEMTKQVPEKILQGIVDKTPLARMGFPDDIANAYLFLASDEASFINGAVLSVDGGINL